MALPIIAGVARASIGGVVSGAGRWSNTWHVELTAGGTLLLADIDNIRDNLVAFYNGFWIPQTHSTSTLDSVDVTPLDGSSGAYHTGYSLVGTGTGSAGVAELANVITIRTSLAGRRRRGRIFLPAFTAATYDTTGHIASGTISALATAMSSLASAMAADGLRVGVASYGRSVKVNHTTTPKTYVVTTWTPFFTAATSYSMDNRPDVIRNRKS